MPPLNETGTVAGVTHEWPVETAYYTAEISIWLDEIADVKEWKAEFLKPEAGEVVRAVGAWVYCFDSSEANERVEATLKAVAEVMESHAGIGAEAVMLAVCVPREHSGLGKDRLEEWEDVCLSHGFELICYGAEGTNEFGEKVGVERLREALEANEWATAGSGEEDLDLVDFEFEDDEMGVTEREEAEWTAELLGVKSALADGGTLEDEEVPASATQQAAQVDELEQIFGTLLALKERSAALPEAEKRRMAAQTVRALMKDSGPS